MITLEEQIACVDRELGIREKVYPRWVKQRPPKLTAQQAEQELARMRAVRASLLELKRLRGGGA